MLIIRRLRCVACLKIHHELPDLLIPYKRYEAESIEQIVDATGPIDVAVDESTLTRWREWFRTFAPYAVGCLRAISKRYHLNVTVGNSSASPRTVLQDIGRKEGKAVGWLANVVRPIANVHLWIHTRSAFLSASP